MKAKKLFMIGAFSALSFLGNAQALTHIHDWTTDNITDESATGESIVISDDGYNYTAGTFQQTIEFQGPSTLFLTSNGAKDVYICKRNANKQLIWAKSIGGSSHDDVIAIDSDDENNIYITGRFYGTADFDPSLTSSFNMTQTGGLYADVYVCKLDENGLFVWAKKLDGNNSLESTDITVDNRNDVHVTGSFSGQVDVNPAPSIFGLELLTSAGSGDKDGFSVTLDQNGIYKKSYHLKGANSDASIKGVAVDPYYNQVFTGEFTGTSDFDHGAATYNMTSTGLGADAFIIRLNPFNGFQWSKQLETSVASYAKSIKIDGDKNIYTIGTFSGNIDMNPNGTVDLRVNSTLRTHTYVSKLAVNGHMIYGRVISGYGPIWTRGNVHGEDLHVTNGGKVYVAGYFDKIVDLNPGIGTAITTAVGIEDAFICGLNTSGNLMSTSTIESHYSYGTVRNNAIDLSAGEDIYTAGTFTEMADFNPTGYPYYRISLGVTDMFTHKLDSYTPPFNPFKSASTIEEAVKIEVYPNPTANFINLNIPGDQRADVVIHSVSGQVVYSGEHKAGLSVISLSDFSEGVYILLVNQGETTQRIKVVKK